MILDRPLKEVPTRALYALHKGIEKTDGLIRGTYRDRYGYTCALGSVGNQLLPIMMDAEFRSQLLDTLRLLEIIGSVTPCKTEIFINGGVCIHKLNDDFLGSPQKRREFMLRHIVNELMIRREYVNPKPAPKKELVLNG